MRRHCEFVSCVVHFPAILSLPFVVEEVTLVVSVASCVELERSSLNHAISKVLKETHTSSRNSFIVPKGD